MAYAKKKVAYAVLGVILVVVGTVLAYRYWNRPVQNWSATDFAARNPQQLTTKSNGTPYWTGSASGQGFYVVNDVLAAGSAKTYCVSGGVGSGQATFMFDGQSFTARNGYFSRCKTVTLGMDKRISFQMVSGQVQVYRVERKR